jgi:hypothetical protein
VLLVADSATTRNTDYVPKERDTSFGQLQRREDKTVEESAMKIVALGDDLVIGLCGDAAGALECARFLDGHHARLRSPDLLHAFLQSDSWRSYGSIELLIASRENGSVVLRLWRSWTRPQRMVRYPPGSTVRIGSIANDPALDATSALLVHGVTNSRQTPQNELPSLAIALQAMSIREDLIRAGVGGAFVAVELGSETGIRWMPDIAYLVYDPEDVRANLVPEPPSALQDAARQFSNIGIVRVGVRDDYLVIAQLSPNRFLKAMGTGLRPRGEHARRWFEVISSTVMKPPAEYVAFLNLRHSTVAILNSKVNREQFQLDFGEDLSLVVREDILPQLLDAPPSGDPHSWHFRYLFEAR